MRNRRMIIILVIIMSAMSLSLMACSANGTAIRTSVPAGTVSVEKQVPANQVEEYRINAGDVLSIKFFYNPELNDSSVTVRPDGRITLQPSHEIVAVGLTPAQLSESLTETYAPELAKPTITVSVIAFGGQKIYVDGEVNKPGSIFVSGRPLTVLQALAEAGGVSDRAKTNDVIVIRRTDENVFNLFSVNTEKVKDGTDMSQDILLMASDIVYVPRTSIANLDIFIDQYIKKVFLINTSVGYYYTNTHTITSP